MEPLPLLEAVIESQQLPFADPFDRPLEPLRLQQPLRISPIRIVRRPLLPPIDDIASVYPLTEPINPASVVDVPFRELPTLQQVVNRDFVTPQQIDEAVEIADDLARARVRQLSRIAETFPEYTGGIDDVIRNLDPEDAIPTLQNIISDGEARRAARVGRPVRVAIPVVTVGGAGRLSGALRGLGRLGRLAGTVGGGLAIDQMIELILPPSADNPGIDHPDFDPGNFYDPSNPDAIWNRLPGELGAASEGEFTPPEAGNDPFSPNFSLDCKHEYQRVSQFQSGGINWPYRELWGIEPVYYNVQYRTTGGSYSQKAYRLQNNAWVQVAAESYYYTVGASESWSNIGNFEGSGFVPPSAADGVNIVIPGNSKRQYSWSQGRQRGNGARALVNDDSTNIEMRLTAFNYQGLPPAIQTLGGHAPNPNGNIDTFDPESCSSPIPRPPTFQDPGDDEDMNCRYDRDQVQQIIELLRFTVDQNCQLVEQMADDVNGLKAVYKSLMQCQDSGVALPESWQGKTPNRPQGVIRWCKVNDQGELDRRTTFTTSIPAYKYSQGYKPALNRYRKGNSWGRMEMNDGSWLLTYAQNQDTAKQVIEQLADLVDDFVLPSDRKVFTGDGKSNYGDWEVGPVAIYYFERGWSKGITLKSADWITRL